MGGFCSDMQPPEEDRRHYMWLGDVRAVED